MKQNIYKSIKNILLICFIFSNIGCVRGKIDPLDYQNGTTRSDIKNSFYRKTNQNKTDQSSATNVQIPKISRMIALPSPPKANNQQLVSFSVTQEVPLKDVLIELAKSAKLDIDLDPEIEGGVIINAKNRPLTEVLERICKMGSLRYSFNKNILHIERDLPFAKNYLVDFLIDGNLWTEVETNINAIISDGGSSLASSGGSITSNKLSNMITVFASEKNHKKVENYLEQVRKNSSAQVLIEAKVIEVTLTDNYKTGIDWTWTKSASTTVTQVGGGASGITEANNPISLVLGNGSLFGGDLTSTVSALEEFGTVKAIASPRINALNNQKATLNFTKKLVYFISEISSNTVTTNGVSDIQNTVTATKNEEDTGTELTITPVIDLNTNEITLSVQPKITIATNFVTQTVVNPTDNSTIENEIPVINTRELNTVAKIQSGNILVIGGVMTEDADNTDRGIPFLNRIPLLGYLFKSTNRTSSVTETVIFIKATIVNPSEGVSKYDREINDKFSGSARPLF